MTRKHYRAIAEVIRQTADNSPTFMERARVREIAEGLASVLAADNPRFQRSRFLEACGVER